MLSKFNVSALAGQPPLDLVLERLPNGELAWLRPSSDACEPDDALYVITDLGHRVLAEYALFGPSPSVAEVVAGHRAGNPRD